MIRRRESPDGLPFRVYERRGTRDYSIGYKLPSGAWAFRLKCAIDEKAKILELRREACTRASQITLGAPAEDSIGALLTAWMLRQRALPEGSRRADSTLDENEREIANLRKAFGHMPIGQIEKSDAYAYLDACLTAKAKDGTPRPRPEKGNKEISLMRTILESGSASAS
jgi:hypothetical protein